MLQPGRQHTGVREWHMWLPIQLSVHTGTPLELNHLRDPIELRR
jgi:hypothetical protein